MFRTPAPAAKATFCIRAKTPSCLKRPWMCRLLTVTVGVALFLIGVRVGDFAGLVLMIVGLVPTVIGAADVSVISEIRDERAHRLEQRRPGWSRTSAALESPSRAAGHLARQKPTSSLALRHSADRLSLVK
jgi:hypothetical protein